MLRMMCVTAHPDDEAGGFGGSLRLYAERGVRTCIVCLTPGQAASHRGGTGSDQELAEMRRREFAASCRILKAEGEVLDYADGALDRADFQHVVGELVWRIRRFRPHVLLTLGPEGAITAHPDHSMASIFATMAFHWAGRENRFAEQLRDSLRPHRVQKLYYSTANFTLPDRPPISPSPATTVIQIGEHLETKIRAFKAHTSQSPLFPLFENAVRRRGQQELFHLAATVRPMVLALETDLFAGVEES